MMTLMATTILMVTMIFDDISIGGDDDVLMGGDDNEI